MKKNVIKEVNATVAALATAAEQAPAVAYINEVCEQAPAEVVADVVKRTNDWLAVEGHTANDPYIWQQARYIARFVKTHCASCNEDTQDFVYVPGSGTYNGKDGSIECSKCFADKHKQQQPKMGTLVTIELDSGGFALVEMVTVDGKDLYLIDAEFFDNEEEAGDDGYSWDDELHSWVREFGDGHTEPELTIEDILNDVLAHNFTPEQIDDIAFYPDIDAEDAYTWRFELYGKEYMLSFIYCDKVTELREVK